jgi:hypothetical protein
MALCAEVPTYHREYVSLISQAAKLIDGKFNLPPMQAELEAFQRNWLFPAGELLKDALTVFVLALLFFRLADRDKPRLSDFAVPEGFVWALAAGLLFAISGWFRQAGNYWLMAAALCYILGGFAVVRLYYERVGKSRFAEWLFYIVQPGLLFAPVFLLGLFETWLNFRGRIDNWDNDQKTDKDDES